MDHEAIKSYALVAYVAFVMGVCIGVVAGKLQTLEQESPCAKRAREAMERRIKDES